MSDPFDFEVAWAVEETAWWPVTPCRWLELLRVYTFVLDFRWTCTRFYWELLVVERLAVPAPRLRLDLMIPPLIVLIMLLVKVSVVTFLVRPGWP